MGGRFCSLEQLYKKFSRNDVFPSPKLNEDQKQEKGLRRKLKSFFPEIRRTPKKKGLRPNLRPFSAGNLWDLLVLAGYFSSGHPALNSRWAVGGRLNLNGGTLNLDWGTLTLDGGTRPPYNLSTG